MKDPQLSVYEPMYFLLYAALMLIVDNKGRKYELVKDLALPAIKLTKLSQINSARWLEQENSRQNWAHIPPTLPYKCAVKLCACSSVLGLLCQFQLLDGNSHQTS